MRLTTGRSPRRATPAVALLLAAASVLIGAAPAHADSIRDREYWLDDYGIREAWNVSRGAGQTIAIIDTGVDGTHQDLAGAVVGGVDFSTVGSANGQTPVGSDDSSHGTMVASLAAGRGRGTSGVIGAAPGASLLAISIGFSESNGPSSDDQIADAVRWAVDNGATVINMSLTRNTLEWPTSWDDAFKYAMDKDVVIVAAAGNRGSGTSQVGAPATMPGVLTVGGVDRNREASWDASSQGISIAVSAPSEQLVGAVPGDGYVLWDGTSGATPIMAGIVALVRAAHPGLDAANVIQRIIATATPAGVEGADPIYGYGLVDAAAAVSATVPAVTANPMGDLGEWIRINRRAQAVTPEAETLAPTPSASATPGPGASGGGSNDEPFFTLGLWRDVGIPVLLFAVFGASFVLLVLAGVRQFRAARRRE
ncbi:type VII secretion-associated serine protease mycosin [Conyzicola nivalis]|uniref:Type VII secretion-associated serine protease mycosin n=1 Tax=Conyzicola nivalis TaxID=1477021 RepID=A0ABV2QMM7_9MICO